MQLIFLFLVATAVSARRVLRAENRSETCVLPPYPKDGMYVVAGDPSAKPGDERNSAALNVTCSQGHSVTGNHEVLCVNGQWSSDIPKCVHSCHLKKHASVKYQCIIPGSEGEESRECNDYEPSGTIVKPQCRKPNYYYEGALPYMRCIEGSWDYVAVCLSECGRVPESTEDLLGNVKETTLPWHATIYKKDRGTYRQICGGSIISNTIIVTAAHCFWSSNSEKTSPSDYAVVVGKTHRGLGENEQKYLVNDIKIPVRFQGPLANFQDDIALVTLNSALEYSLLVRPVCVDFDINFERRQLQQGSLGKVAAWPDTAVKDSLLQILELPYVTVEECIQQTPVHFREYITSDKICAGVRNGTSLCSGNSGTGLSFPVSERGLTRYYLRGVLSTSPQTESTSCASVEFVAFTQVNKHEHFIRDYFV